MKEMIFLFEWLLFTTVTAQEFSVDLKALYDNQGNPESMTTKGWKKFYSEPPQTLETDAQTDPHIYKDVSHESAKTEHNSESSDAFGLFRHFDEPKILPDNELLLAETLPVDEDLDTKQTRTLAVSQENLFRMISLPLPVGPSTLEIVTKPMKCIKEREAEKEAGEEVLNFIKSINQNPKGDAYDVFLSSFLSTRNMDPAPKQYQYHANEYGYGRKYQGPSILNKPILVQRPTIKIRKKHPGNFNQKLNGAAYDVFFSFRPTIDMRTAPKQYQYHENEYGYGRKYQGAHILPTLVRRPTTVIAKEDLESNINKNLVEDTREASFSYLPARSSKNSPVQHDENEGYGERLKNLTVVPILAPQSRVKFNKFQGVTVIPEFFQRTTDEYLTNAETVNYEAVLKFLSTLIMNDKIIYINQENKTTDKLVTVSQKEINETAAENNVIALQAPAESKGNQNMLDRLEAVLKNRLREIDIPRAQEKSPHTIGLIKKKKHKQGKVFSNITKPPTSNRYRVVVKPKIHKDGSQKQFVQNTTKPLKRYRLIFKPVEQKNFSKPREQNDIIAPELLERVNMLRAKLNKNKDKPDPLDLPGLMDVIDNLTLDWSADLVHMINKSIREQMLPTCSTPKNDDEEEYSTDDDSDEENLTGVVMAKCFVCGMEDPEMPFDTHCADAFSTDTWSMQPMHPVAKTKIAAYRKRCRWKNIPGYESKSVDVWGRWTGGCSVRWIDISGMYTQRTCRNKHVPAMGRHWASKRMAKLELALKDANKGCIVSPVASLVPMSRSISLYARFHACVCSGDWCNHASVHRPWSSSIAIISINTMMSSFNIAQYFLAGIHLL